MAVEFKIGDKIKRARSGYCGNMIVGDTGVIIGIKSPCDIQVRADKGGSISNHDGSNLDLIEVVKTNNIFMDLKSKVALLFMGEPEKTFVKAGLANTNGELTSEGKEIFLNYMLRKMGADFKKDIADPIVAEQEKK